ncbi:hypothetical protein ACFUVV_11805 [Streptomyces sp. NPDC057376]|uniref:hypothetical protein n=1 Tax=unclassified Streptomyces TaxID=2593676 RepID=UPI00093CC5E9|nr:hypothetical protein [Streptomyces sp. CB02414]OKI90406.1 hypothetical protein AMK11_04565 [Streptomyces sp. CB02414]
MPERRESGERLAGRLYATLRVLKFLAEPGAPKPTVEDAFTTKDSPYQRIQALRLDPFKALVAAAHKNRHTTATGEVFRALPAVVPPEESAYMNTLSPARLAEFNAGHRAQLMDLEKSVPDLLG